MDEYELLYYNNFQRDETRKKFWADILRPWKYGFSMMVLSLVIMSIIFFIESSSALIPFILLMLIVMFTLISAMIIEVLYTYGCAKNVRIYKDGIYDSRKKEKIVSFNEISSVSHKYSDFLFRLENGRIEKISKYIILDLEKFNNILKSKGVETLFERYAIHPSLAKLK